jgi:CheY-like chemotaxis protein
MKPTWLVVEDDPIIRAIFTALMALWDVHPLVFKDGFEVTAWIEKFEKGGTLPELALLDMRLPGPQGIEIAQHIRNHPVLKDTPIIMMTAYQLSPSKRDEIMQTARPDRLIQKPLPSPTELRTIIENVLAERKGHSGNP